MFDSLAVDVDGNICVATLGAGGITVLSPSGDLVEFVKIPTEDTHITNICFGGPDLDTAYVTSSGSGSVWEISGWRRGLRLNYSS
jgi:gluconolactonase